MTFYDLGLSSDALNVSVLDEIISFTGAFIFLIFTFYLIFNLRDFNSESKSRLERFLSISNKLTASISVVSAIVTLTFATNTIYLLAKTSPNTIVERRYSLDHGTRTVEVKDDFKTVYANEEDVEFSSSLEESSFDRLPQDLLHDLRLKGISRSKFFSTKDSGDFTIFSTKEDLNLQQVEAMRILSNHKHVIEINASKSDQSVKVLATIDSVEVTKEEENEENLAYHIDKIEMADAVETISRDSQSKSRDIKSIKIHISGKTSESAKAKKSIEKLVE